MGLKRKWLGIDFKLIKRQKRKERRKENPRSSDDSKENNKRKRKEKVGLGRWLTRLRVLTVCEDLSFKFQFSHAWHDHTGLESQHCVRAEAGEPAGLAGCQPRASFSERPHLRGVRMTVTECDT